MKVLLQSIEMASFRKDLKFPQPQTSLKPLAETRFNSSCSHAIQRTKKHLYQFACKLEFHQNQCSPILTSKQPHAIPGQMGSLVDPSAALK